MAASALGDKPGDSELLLPQEIHTLNKVLEAAQSNAEYPRYQEGKGAFGRKEASPHPKYIHPEELPSFQGIYPSTRARG